MRASQLYGTNSSLTGHLQMRWSTSSWKKLETRVQFPVRAFLAGPVPSGSRRLRLCVRVQFPVRAFLAGPVPSGSRRPLVFALFNPIFLIFFYHFFQKIVSFFCLFKHEMIIFFWHTFICFSQRIKVRFFIFFIHYYWRVTAIH
jgi:hypothetical protein